MVLMVQYQVRNSSRPALGQTETQKSPRWVKEGTKDIPTTLAAVGTVAVLAIAGALLLK